MVSTAELGVAASVRKESGSEAIAADECPLCAERVGLRLLDSLGGAKMGPAGRECCVAWVVHSPLFPWQRVRGASRRRQEAGHQCESLGHGLPSAHLFRLLEHWAPFGPLWEGPEQGLGKGPVS